MALMFGAAIRTRTSVTDYAWVGRTLSPEHRPGDTEPEEWWRDGWGNPLLHEGVCLLRSVDGSDIRWLLTGIESERRDSSSSQTRISYDLLFESEQDGALTEAQVGALVREWWSQRSLSGDISWGLGLQFDVAIERLADRSSCSVDEFLTDGAYQGMAADVVLATDLVRRLGSGSDAGLKSDGKDAERVDPLGQEWAWVGADSEFAEDFVLRGGSMVYCRELTKSMLPDLPSASNMQESVGVAPGVVVVVDDSDEVQRHPKPVPPEEGEPQKTSPERTARMLRTLALAGAVILMLILIAVLTIGP